MNTIRRAHRETATKIWKETLADALTLRLPVPVWQWAEKNRVLRGVTAKPGPYRVEVAPFMREPQDSFHDPAVQTTVLCCASRTGKTETELNLTGYTIDHDPRNVLWVYPTLDSARKWRKEFLSPMLRDTPCLRGKVRPARSKDSDNTILGLGFPGGRLSAIGTNSRSAFRQVQAPVVICEEVDAMDETEEGDPVTLAFKRSDNYPDNVQIVSSTPTRTGASRVWTWLESSDFRKWECPCRQCARPVVWTWKDVAWDEGKPETARLVCPHCATQHNDAERRASVAAGAWRGTKPFHGVRGYWLNGLNSLFPPKRGFVSSLHQWVSEFLAAKDNRGMLRTWTNTFLAECFDEDPALDISENEFLNRAEDYTPDGLPSAVLIVTAGIDVQANRIEIEFAGWGADEERFGIDKRILDGNPEQAEVWNALAAELDRTFTREDGVPLAVERAFVDMQYSTKQVLAFCAPRIGRGVYPCRGVNRTGLNVPPLLPAKPSRNNRARIPHWNVGVTVAKSAIHDRIVVPVPGPRALHWPHGFGYDHDHFRQLMAEKRLTRYQYGQRYFIFAKTNAAARNEALDLMVYSLAALESLGRINWRGRAEILAKQAKEKPEPAQENPATVEGQPPPPTEPPAAQRTRVVPRRNFVTGWR